MHWFGFFHDRASKKWFCSNDEPGDGLSVYLAIMATISAGKEVKLDELEDYLAVRHFSVMFHNCSELA